ncbi:MAG: hypothetical protein ACK2T6_02325, partial [Anaerolineae bacterium]
MAPMAHRPQPSARAFLLGSLLAIALAFTVAGSVATAGRVARPSDSTASASGYSLVDTWRDVPDVTRVVAGLDGQMHLLATGGSSVWHTASDGTLLSQTPTYGLSDIAVDPSGNLYAIRDLSILRLDAAGGPMWSDRIEGQYHSILGERPPYLQALAWNPMAAKVTLIYDMDTTFSRHYSLVGVA